MLKINVRYQSNIEYYNTPLSSDATHWIDQFLCNSGVVLSHDNPDFLEIEDIEYFKKKVDESKPPEHIKKEVKAFFDTCTKAYNRLGTIYIDLWE